MCKAGRMLCWLLILIQLAWLGGCTSYRHVTLDQNDFKGKPSAGDLALRPGGPIRVGLDSGEVLVGTLDRLTETELVMRQLTERDGYQPRTIPLAEIEWMTTRAYNPTATGATAVAGSAVVVFVMVLGALGAGLVGIIMH